MEMCDLCEKRVIQRSTFVLNGQSLSFIGSKSLEIGGMELNLWPSGKNKNLTMFIHWAY